MYLEPGSSIGEYRLVERLRRRDGLSIQALDPEGKLVAVKVMLAEAAGDDDDRERTLSSTPADAVIEVHGSDSGHRTPAMLALHAPPVRHRLLRAGYETADVPGLDTAGMSPPLSIKVRRLLKVSSVPPVPLSPSTVRILD
jgi:hypothetical protein